VADEAPKRTDHTRTARTRALRSRGLPLSETLKDPAAIAELERLRAVHGSRRAALEAVLLASAAAERRAAVVRFDEAGQVDPP
jgi:hypothetical protein